MKHGKRYNELKASFDGDKTYDLEEAIALAKKTGNTKFDSSIEVHVRLGIDPKKGDQQVRSTVSLPHGTGKTKRVAAFVSPEKEKEAQEAGANPVGGEELVAQIVKTGKCDFDVAVAEPSMMPKLAKAAKVLGPRGLMPSPKNETVTPNVGQAIKEMMGGKVAFKNDDTANIHLSIGKVSFDDTKIVENYTAFMDALNRAKPNSAKGAYLKGIVLTTTMGPAIRVNA